MAGSLKQLQYSYTDLRPTRGSVDKTEGYILSFETLPGYVALVPVDFGKSASDYAPGQIPLETACQPYLHAFLQPITLDTNKGAARAFRDVVDRSVEPSTERSDVS